MFRRKIWKTVKKFIAAACAVCSTFTSAAPAYATPIAEDSYKHASKGSSYSYITLGFTLHPLSEEDANLIPVDSTGQLFNIGKMDDNILNQMSSANDYAIIAWPTSQYADNAHAVVGASGTTVDAFHLLQPQIDQLRVQKEDAFDRFMAAVADTTRETYFAAVANGILTLKYRPKGSSERVPICEFYPASGSGTDYSAGFFRGNGLFTYKDGMLDDTTPCIASEYSSMNFHNLLDYPNVGWSSKVRNDITRHYLMSFKVGKMPTVLGLLDNDKPDVPDNGSSLTREPDDPPVTYTFNPIAYTYHKSSEFKLGEGIPSGENLTNGVFANKMAGSYSMQKKGKVTATYKISISKITAHFRYDYYYTTENKKTGEEVRHPSDESDDPYYHGTYTITYKPKTQEEKNDLTFTTTREAFYYVLNNAELSQLSKVTVENDAYGNAIYTANIGNISADAKVNGQKIKANATVTTFIADESKHISWSKNPGSTWSEQVDLYEYEPDDNGILRFKLDENNKYVPINLGTYEGKNSEVRKEIKGDDGDAQEWFDDWLDDEKDGFFKNYFDNLDTLYVEANNDYFQLNGKTIMSDKKVKSYTAGVAPAVPEPLGMSASTTPAIESIDRSIRDDQQSYNVNTYHARKTEYITPDTRNGTYATSLEAEYKQVLPNNGVITYYSASDEAAITEQYEENEPIRVHTPVIAPVKITDGETKTQLITENTISSGVYKFLLDGTYTVEFLPDQWADTEFGELRGYENDTWTADRYDKYVFEKKIRFPFDVAVSDPRTSKETYYGVKSGGYTDWIECPENKFTFYIPTWAEETTTHFNGDNSKAYDIQFRVEATNAEDGDGGQNEMNSDLESHAATYDIYANVSGSIYGFQIVGVNDKDMFKGYDTNASESTDYPFALYRQEKKAGSNNRFGNPFVRYTIDGQIKGKWADTDVLALRPGSSNKYSSMGALWKGSTFSFSVKTIANLGDSMEDKVLITPTYGYIDENGTYHKPEELAIYYSDNSGNFIEYDSSKDHANVKSVSLSSDQFKGSWYEGQSLLFSTSLKNQLLSKKDGTGRTYLSIIPDDLSYTAHKAGKTPTAFKNTKTPSYNLSQIVLNQNMRLLTGDAEELERNQSYERTSPNFDTLPNMIGNGKASENTFRDSMQTWYGQYTVPAELYVTYRNQFDPNEDGHATSISKHVTPHTGDDLDGNGVVDLRDLAKAEKLTKDSDIWLKNGYLVLNFDISTKNNGNEHLRYGGDIYPTVDMWDNAHENHVSSVTVEKQKPDGTPETEKVPIPSRPGDVVLIDNRYSTKDKYSARIFMTN